MNKYIIKLTALVCVLTLTPVTALGEEKKRIDRYGQFIDVDYPSKIKSDEQLIATVKRDEEYYKTLSPPKNWDMYGGLVGSKDQLGLTETGFFHVEKLDNGNWVMVNPLGNLFFSVGLNCTGALTDTYTTVTGREEIYEWIPPFSTDGLYAGAFLNGDKGIVSFYAANLIKKFQKPFDKKEFIKETINRMHKWGFNTAGGFSDVSILEDGLMPMSANVGMPVNAKIPGVKLYDVFRPTWEQELDLSAKGPITKMKDNKWVIGYVIDNELEFDKLPLIIPSSKASRVACKQKLVDILREKYNEDIAAFNSAWEMKYESFEEVYESTSLSVRTEQASLDFNEYMELYFDTFYRTIAEVVRRYDPNHMLTGDRLAGNTPEINLMASKHLGKYGDLITRNYYAYDPNLEMLRETAEVAGKPIMLTEFHFSDPTQGLKHGSRIVANAEEKGLYYRNYMEKIATSGVVVGAHWFIYNDQSATGRYFQGFNGESSAVGLVDVADQPYRSVVDAMKETNDIIYDVLLGKREPFVYENLKKEKEVNSVIWQIPRVNEPIVIDAKLDAAMSEVPELVLEDTHRVVGAYENDIGVNARFAWDEKNLFLFADILDTTPLNAGKRLDLAWNGDGIELFIGPEEDKLNVDGSLLPKDTQLIIAGGYSDEGKMFYYWYNNRLEQPEIEMSLAPTEKGYIIEARVPFESLNIDNPSDGRMMRFDVALDNAHVGTGRVLQYIWNGQDGNSRSRSNWGRAILVDALREIDIADHISTDKGDANDVSIKVLINNKPVEFGDAQPVIVEGRTLVPLRATFEAFDIQVSWNALTQTVTGTKEGKSISLTIDRETAVVDGNQIELDVPAMIIQDRTMVPARFIAESLGCKVEWNGEKKEVAITHY